jgi:hypothetical protein
MAWRPTPRHSPISLSCTAPLCLSIASELMSVKKKSNKEAPILGDILLPSASSWRHPQLTN